MRPFQLAPFHLRYINTITNLYIDISFFLKRIPCEYYNCDCCINRLRRWVPQRTTTSTTRGASEIPDWIGTAPRLAKALTRDKSLPVLRWLGPLITQAILDINQWTRKRFRESSFPFKFKCILILAWFLISFLQMGWSLLDGRNGDGLLENRTGMVRSEILPHQLW